MTRNPGPTERPAPLSPGELFLRYLNRQAEAQASGLGPAEPVGEVEPYESVAEQPVDARLAWSDAIAAASFLGAPAAEWPVPPDWPALVAAPEPAVAVPFCLGNFPQLVRDLQPLMEGTALSASAERGTPVQSVGLVAWAEGQKGCPSLLLAAGVLRLAKHFDEAQAALQRLQDVPAAWSATHANESAALAWHRGHYQEALRSWEAQAASVPVLFNRGMACLFLGRPADARGPLARAVSGLPETSAWHHLGQLYRTLAEARA